MIGTEGGNDQLLAKNRQLVQDTLAKTFGQPGNGKLDLNNASTEQLADASDGSAADAPACSFPMQQVTHAGRGYRRVAR